MNSPEPKLYSMKLIAQTMTIYSLIESLGYFKESQKSEIFNLIAFYEKTLVISSIQLHSTLDESPS